MKTPDHIDGVPITKPCAPHDRGYIKGWQARQGEISVLIYTVKLAYRKHHLGDSSIGWGELSDILCDTLCESMGDNEFQEWVNKQNKP